VLAARGALAFVLGVAACSRSERPSYVDAVRADRPASYWRFGEADTSHGALDAIAGKDGAIQSGVTVRAPGALAHDADTAFAFDGVHGAVVIPNAYTFEGIAAFSVELWLSLGTGGASTQRISNHRIGDTGWRLVRTEPQRIAFERWNNAVLLGAAAADLPIGTYAHVVGRYDGATIAIYVDGELRASAPDAHAIDHFEQTLVWGAGNVGDIDFFVGNIDEPAIYDFALAPDRIAAHHAAGAD
jgi:hypothetical protein